MIKQFFKDSFIYALSNVLSRGIGLLLLPLYTRFFSPKDYGIIDMMVIVAHLVHFTVALEITQAVARFFPESKDQEEKSAYTSTAFWFTVFMFILCWTAAYFFAAPLCGWILGSGSLKIVFMTATTAICLQGIYIFMRNQLRWQLQSKYFGITSILYTLVSAGTTVFLITVMRTGVIGFFYGIIAGSLAGCAAAWLFVRSSYRITFYWEKCREMLRFSIPLVPSSVAVFFSSYMDRIAIKKLMTLEDLGIYGIAFRFASSVGLLLIGFQASLMPLVYKNYKNASTPGEIAKIYSYFLALMLPLILGLSLFSPELIRIFTTSGFYTAAPIIFPLALAISLTSMYIFVPGLGIDKKTKLIAGINIISSLTNLGLNFLLIPIFGLMGAASATLFSAFLAFLLYILLSQKYYPVPHPWPRISVGVMVTGIFIFLGWFINSQEITSGIIAVTFKSMLWLAGIVALIGIIAGFKEIKSIVDRTRQKLHSQ
jgi:O-antigen/teichoic acid export membrane protein